MGISACTKEKIINNTKKSYNFLSKSLFIKENILGIGTFGKVWKVKYINDEKEYAMKVISKEIVLAKNSFPYIFLELRILANLNNPFICNINYAFQDSNNLYLILDLVDSGDLRFQLTKDFEFNEPQVKFISACLILALECLHSFSIIHRDLKPENILIDSDGYIKITDFGFATLSTKEDKGDLCGSPGYIAPEVINKKPYGTSADYWALGVIIHELLLLHRPYKGKNFKDYSKSLNEGNIAIDYGKNPKGWSDLSLNFIKSLLKKDPTKRLGYKGINELKEHPWFRDIDWIQLQNKKIKSPIKPFIFDVASVEIYMRNLNVKDINKTIKKHNNEKKNQIFQGYYYDKERYSN